MTPTEVQPQNAAPETQVAPQSTPLDQMRAELLSIPGARPEEVEAMLKDFNVAPPATQAAAPTEVQTPTATITPTQEVAPAATPVETPPAEAPKPTGNPILDAIALPEQKPTSYENFEQAAKEITDKYGIEVKDFGDTVKLAQQTSELRQQLDTVNKEVTTLRQYETLMTSLPEEVYSLFEMVVKGEYDKSKLGQLSGVILDYNKPFESQDRKTLIEKYAPHLLEDEDYMEDKERVEKDIKLVKALYDKDQVDFKGKIQTRLAQNQEAEKKLTQSAISSFNNLSNIDYFKLGEPQKAGIAKIMNQGQQGVLDLYFNPDGTWKQEASEVIALNLYSKEAIREIKKMIANRVETKTNEQILSRGNDTPPVSKPGVVTTQQQQEAFMKEIEDMLPKSQKSVFS